jgi:hypothetical protein
MIADIDIPRYVIEKRIQRRRARIAKLGQEKPVEFDDFRYWRWRIKPYDGRTVTKNYSIDTDF